LRLAFIDRVKISPVGGRNHAETSPARAGASAACALPDDVPRHRLRRTSFHLPLRLSERGPSYFSDRLLSRVAAVPTGDLHDLILGAQGDVAESGLRVLLRRRVSDDVPAAQLFLNPAEDFRKREFPRNFKQASARVIYFRTQSHVVAISAKLQRGFDLSSTNLRTREGRRVEALAQSSIEYAACSSAVVSLRSRRRSRIRGGGHYTPGQVSQIGTSEQ
jgi:hypothetical protein